LLQDFFDKRIPLLDHGVNHPKWRGVKLRKFPTDLILYSQVIYKLKPDFIVETGSAEGGSALFFGDMMELFGGQGHVISIDINKPNVSHKRVELITGSSVDISLFENVSKKLSGKVMVTLDSDHDKKHVYNELSLYSGIVTSGQYLVCEDTYRRGRRLRNGPGRAISRFLNENKNFKMENVDDDFYYGCTRGGWLKKL
jgi:cephalosporin hydroxylase